MVPGTRALAFAARWFDERTVARVFEPLIADWQREWHDSEASRRAWVSVRGFAAFACAIAISSPQVALTAAPPSVVNRVVFRIACFTLPVSLLFSFPIIVDIDQAWAQGAAFLLLLPSGMVLAFPFAMVIAMDAIRGGEPLPPHIERALVLKLGATAVALVVLFGGWVVPAANQVWRVEMAPDPSYVPPRGVRELTTLELFTDPARASAAEPFTRRGRSGAINREKNNRAVLAVLPAVLLWLRWGQLQRPRRKWYAPLPWSVATVMAFVGFLALYMASVVIEPKLNLSPGTGLWTPILAFALLGVAQPIFRAPRR